MWLFKWHIFVNFHTNSHSFGLLPSWMWYYSVKLWRCGCSNAWITHSQKIDLIGLLPSYTVFHLKSELPLQLILLDTFITANFTVEWIFLLKNWSKMVLHHHLLGHRFHNRMVVLIHLEKNCDHRIHIWIKKNVYTLDPLFSWSIQIDQWMLTIFHFL